MSQKAIKKLQFIAFFLQLFTLWITGLMTIFQKTVKAFCGIPSSLYHILNVPVDIFLTLVPMLFLYGISAIFVTKFSHRNTRLQSVLCITATIILKIAAFVTNLLYPRFAAVLLNSSSYTSGTYLTSAINTVISPFQTVAFILFCVSLGAYYGLAPNYKKI